MRFRAAEVVRLLEELRRLTLTEGSSGDALKVEESRTNAQIDIQGSSGRAPKRPWEDISGDESGAVRNEQYSQVCFTPSFRLDRHHD